MTAFLTFQSGISSFCFSPIAIQNQSRLIDDDAIHVDMFCIVLKQFQPKQRPQRTELRSGSKLEMRQL